MKRIFLLLLALLPGASWATDLAWSQMPSAVAAGDSYSAVAESWTNDVTITIYENGSYVASDTGSPSTNGAGNAESFKVWFTTTDRIGPVEYSATVRRWGTIENTISATVTINGPPWITAQPQSQTLNTGSNASFSVTATGSGTLYYQWRKDGTDITGKTTNALSLPNVQATDAGLYDVTVWNTYGSTVSSSAKLVINLPAGAPVISTQPTDQTSAAVSLRSMGLIDSDGGPFSIALKPDGTVWAWGANDVQQLGDGTTTDRSTPVQVAGVTNAVGVSAGGQCSAARKADNTTATWGISYFGGQAFSSLTGIVEISVGVHFSLALRNDGTVWAVGYNGSGQLGNGTTTTTDTPVQVTGLTGVVAISAGGGYNSMALKSDGTVWCWGSTLGDGSGGSSSTPVQVSALSGVTAIAAGQALGAAIKDDGTLWTWGWNGYGQIGDGTTTTRSSPVQVLSNVARVATSGGAQTLILKTDGTVWGWGNNYFGQLGDGSNTNRSTPVQTSTISGVVAIGEGYDHGLAVKNDGTVWAWGANNRGQVGDGTTTARNTPVQVSGLSGLGPISIAQFTVAATGSPTPSYQWQRKAAGQSAFSNVTNGSVYSGATGSVLTVRNATSSMHLDQFRCVTSNSYGTVASNAGYLIIPGVSGAPVITEQPQSKSFVSPGDSVTLRVSVVATPAATFQWKKNGTAITNATSASLTLTNIGTSDLAIYTVTATNILGTAISGDAVVAFDAPPSAPSALNYVERTATTITLLWQAAVDDRGVISYGIYRGGTLIGSTTDLIYFDHGLTVNTSYSYTVKALDAAGHVSSASNTLTVSTAADFSADSDHDGIPDVVETVLGTTSSTATFDSTNSTVQRNIHRPIQ